MKRLYWYIAGILSVITIGTAGAMFVGGELESALLEKLSSDPTGNEAQIYYNTTSKKARLYNGTAWTALGGGGAGEVNYNDDADGDANFPDALAGTGLTASVTTTEAQVPRWPIKTQALLLTNDNSGTAGESLCIEVGASDRNKKLKIEWAQVADNNYASGDFTYQLFSETNDTCSGTETGIVLHSSGDTSAVSIPAQDGVMYDEFDATDAQYYELKFVRAAGSSSGTLGINDLVIGPGKLHSGAVVTAWEAFTPTGAWSSNVSYAGTKRRVGDNLEMHLQLIGLTSFNSTGNFYFNVPDGLTIDTNKITSTLRMVGYANIYDNNSAANRQSAWVNVSSNTLRVYADGAAQVSETSPFTFNVSDRISAIVSVPILEWQGSGVLNVITQDNLSGKIAYTPGDSRWGNSSASGYYKRIGDEAYIDVADEFDGSITGDWYWSASDIIPPGLTLHETQLTIGAGGDDKPVIMGNCIAIDSAGSPSEYGGTVFYDKSSNIFYCLLSDADRISAASPVTWTGSDGITMHIKVPITEWAGSQSSLVGFSAATETQSGLVDTGTQTFAGQKTFKTASLYQTSGTGGSSQMYFQNNDISQTGFRVGIGSTEIAYLLNSENTEMQFWTNNLERMSIAASGGVTINQGLSVLGADVSISNGLSVGGGTTSDVIDHATVGTTTGETCLTNCDSAVCNGENFIRVGDAVSFSMTCTFNATVSTGIYRVQVDPPVASNFTSTVDVSGVCATTENSTSAMAGGIYAATVSDDLILTAAQTGSTGNREYKCTGMYAVK